MREVAGGWCALAAWTGERERRQRAAHARRSDIDVTVDKAGVTLQGKVGSYATRYDAEQIVWGTPGVKSVRNKIVVDP